MSLLALMLACAPKSATPKTATGFTDEATGKALDTGVTDFLNRTEPKIIECYLSTLSDPTQADDSVQLQFVIEPSGNVSRVVTRQSTITDAAFTTCVEGLMAKERVSNASPNAFAVTRDYNFRPAK